MSSETLKVVKYFFGTFFSIGSELKLIFVTLPVWEEKLRKRKEKKKPKKLMKNVGTMKSSMGEIDQRGAPRYPKNRD